MPHGEIQRDLPPQAVPVQKNRSRLPLRRRQRPHLHQVVDQQIIPTHIAPRSLGPPMPAQIPGHHPQPSLIQAPQRHAHNAPSAPPSHASAGSPPGPDPPPAPKHARKAAFHPGPCASILGMKGRSERASIKNGRQNGEKARPVTNAALARSRRAGGYPVCTPLDRAPGSR